MNIPPRFPLGKIQITSGALVALRCCPYLITSLLRRHARGDWGNLCPEDRRANDQALLIDTRLHSEYHLPDGAVVWVMTEADRSATTLLLPEEY